MGWRATLHEGEGEDENESLGTTDIFVMVGFLGSMVFLAVGALNWDWYIRELSAVFLGMALICGLLGRLASRCVLADRDHLVLQGLAQRLKSRVGELRQFVQE